MTSTRKKIVTFILITVAGIIIGVAFTFYLSLRMSIPTTSGTIHVNAITNDVQITFDSLGIPQIWATSETDAYFALGFQHAADRLFQMDLTRRIASGRLSEMFGDISHDIDIENRAVGHYRLARKALGELSEHDRLRLEAYVNGVNQYVLTNPSLPFEYRFLPVEFTPWTIEDCLTILSFQCWYSNSLMNRDRFYVDLAKKVGDTKAASLRFDYPHWAPTTVPSEIPSSSLPIPSDNHLRYSASYTSSASTHSTPLQKKLFNSLFADNQYPYLMTESSNAWVIAPEKSQSGFPLLASDPHLELTRLPQFWYAAGLHCPPANLNVLGITTPGLPFVVMGFNGVAGWVFTAGGTDLTDYVTVSVDPENPNRFMADSGWHDFTTIEDSILLIGADSVEHITHRIFDNTVVIESDNELHTATLMHWAGYDRSLSDAFANGFQLHHIASFDSFKETVTHLGALDANYMYADIYGTIGYQLTAPIAMKPPYEGIPSEFEKLITPRDYYPLSETPSSRNPDQGWLASCNNKPSDAFFNTGNYFTTRILRITDLLSAKDSFSVGDMQAYQMDLTDNYSLKIVSLLKANGIFSEDIEFSNNSVLIEDSAIVFVQIFFDKLTEYTFKDELDDLYHSVPRKWLEQIEQVDSAGWFDDITTTTKIETKKEIARLAYEDALRLSKGKAWGDMLTLQMKHPLSLIPVINGLLGLSGPMERWHGSSGTLNASFYSGSPETGYKTIAGPSMRLVIDFVDPTEATIVLPAGNSGNPMSEHFFDFYEMWKSGERWPISLDSSKAFMRAASTLLLQPR